MPKLQAVPPASGASAKTEPAWPWSLLGNSETQARAEERPEVKSPTEMLREAPEAPEAPEIAGFNFEAFAELLEKKAAAPDPASTVAAPVPAPTPVNPAADWQVADARRPQRPSPGSSKFDPADAAVSMAPKPGPAPDGGESHVGMKMEGKNASLAWSNRTTQGETKTDTGATLRTDLKDVAIGAGRRKVEKVDDEGHVEEGSSAAAQLGTDGLSGQMSSTKGGKTTALSTQVGLHHTTVGMSHGDENKNVGALVSMAGNTTTVAVTAKSGPVSGGAFVSETEGYKSGKVGEEGNDAAIHEMMGEATYLSHQSGLAEGASLNVSNNVFGAGGSGYHASEDDVRYFQAGKEAVETSPIPGVAPEPLQGVSSFGDVDTSKLKSGQGYSFEHQHAAGGEGHLTAVGITASLGKDEAGESQTVIARDKEGNLRVAVSQGEQDKLTGKVGVANVLGVKGTDTSSNAASVAFTAKGPEGEAAVKSFQVTGLLPGAEEVAKDVAPDAVATFDAARLAWTTLSVSPPGLDEDAIAAWKDRVDEARKTMMKAAGPVNDAFLQHHTGGLDEAEVPGVEYEDHLTARQKSHDTSLSLLGLDLFHSGSTETEYEEDYKGDDKKSHEERGYERDDSYWFDPTDKSRIRVDPKGEKKVDGDPIALSMWSEVDDNQSQRDTLAAVGPTAFDMPAETVEAWRTGDLADSQLDHVAVTMTEGQLVQLRDGLAKADDAHVQMLAGGAGDLWKQVSAARSQEGQIAAMMPGATDEARLDKARDEELGELYDAAAAARTRKLLMEGHADQLGTFLQGGRDEMLKKVAGVHTAEDFLALTPEEQRLVVTTGAIQAKLHEQNPWEAMRLVLLIKDRAQRDELLRQLYETVERREKGAQAAVYFVQWIQASGAAQGVDVKDLLAGVGVRTADTDVDQIAKDAGKADKETAGEGTELLGKGLAAAVSTENKYIALGMAAMGPGGMFGAGGQGQADHMRQTGTQRDADRITDILQAAKERGGPGGVEAAVATALKEDGDFLDEMWKTLADDPARAAWAHELLKGTRYG